MSAILVSDQNRRQSVVCGMNVILPWASGSIPQAASVSRVSAALDHQQRDIRPAAAQLVGDPGEGVDPFLEARVDERDEAGLAILNRHAVPVDRVGQRLAVEPDRSRYCRRANSEATMQ